MDMAALPGMPDPPNLMTLQEASEVYDIPYQTLYSAVAHGRIPRWRHAGRRVLMLAEDVEKYATVYDKFRDGHATNYPLNYRKLDG